MPSYVTPYRGVNTSLPAGFMDAATAPGRNLAAGIISAADSIAAGEEQHKREQKLASSAQGWFDSLPDESKPMDPIAFKNLSARDKAARVEGFIGAQSYERGKQDMLMGLLKIRGQALQNINEAEMAPLRKTGAELDQERGRMLLDAERLRTKRVENLTNDVASRFDPNFVGPQQPMDSKAMLELLGRNGLLMDPQSDNLLSSVGRVETAKRPAGTPGTVTPVEGDQSLMFEWMTPQSGRFRPKAGAAPQKVPEGYEVWRDAGGNERLVRTPKEDIGSAAEVKLQNLTGMIQDMQQLQALKDKGATHVKRGEAGYESVNGWFGQTFGSSSKIDDEIGKLSQRISNTAGVLKSTNPKAVQKITEQAPAAPAGGGASYNEFLNWRNRQ